MAINALQVAWISRLANKKIIREGDSILEFGPQDVICSRTAVEQYGLRHRDAATVKKVLDEAYDGERPKPVVPFAFYSLFGAERYRSLDLTDPRSDWLRDCNEPFTLPERFDIVTNFGTAEHVFNIAALFQSVHNALKPGGVALHVLPAFGDIDHGFYNIHPTTYLDMAAANGYVIEDLCYVDRWDIRNRTLEENLISDFDFESIPIQMQHLRDRAKLQRMVVELFVANYNHPKTKQFGPAFSGVVYDYCIAALRKVNDAPFRYPLQGYYGGGVAPSSKPLHRSSPLLWRRFASLPSPIVILKAAVRRCVVPLLPKFVKRHLFRSVLKTVLRGLALDVSGVDLGLSITEWWVPFVLARNTHPTRPLTTTAMTQIMTLVEARIERLYDMSQIHVTIGDLNPHFLNKIKELLKNDPNFVAFILNRYLRDGDVFQNRKNSANDFVALFAGQTFLENALTSFSRQIATLTDSRLPVTEDVALEQAVASIENLLENLYNTAQLSFTIKDLDSAFLDQLERSLRSNLHLVGYIADRYLRIGSYYHYEKSPTRKRVINDLLWLIVHPPVAISEKTGNEIKEFAALVWNELGNQPYPLGVVVSTRWRELVQTAMRLVSHLSDPIHIAILAMARLTFDAGMPLLSGDDRPLRERRSEYDRRHPELKTIGESRLALPGTVIDIAGVTFSDNLAQGFSYYDEIFSGLGADAKTGVVVEIGGGFGKLARLLRTSGKARCMVLVDLPESLALCFAFLKINFSDARTHVIRSAADVTTDMAERYDFIFCPIQQLDNLKLNHIDLLINTYSLGEMQQSSVDHILHCVHTNLKPKHLFSLNTIFTDKNIHFAESGNVDEGNEIVLNLQPEWWPLHIDLVERPEGKLYRNEVSIVMERISLPAGELVQRYRDAALQSHKASKNWIMYMFFAALWTADATGIEEFFTGLRQYHIDCGFAQWDCYDFDKIGEVQFLRRRLAAGL